MFNADSETIRCKLLVSDVFFIYIHCTAPTTYSQPHCYRVSGGGPEMVIVTQCMAFHFLNLSSAFGLCEEESG